MCRLTVQLELVGGPEQLPDLLFACDEPTFTLISSKVAALWPTWCFSPPSTHSLLP